MGSNDRNSHRNLMLLHIVLPVTKYNRNHGEGCLLTGLQTGLYSASFLILFRYTCLGMVPPTVSWAFLKQLAIKTQMCLTGQSDIDNFSTEAPFSGDSKLWQSDNYHLVINIQVTLNGLRRSYLYLFSTAADINCH